MFRQPKLYAAIGFFTPLFTFACILLSIASWPEFSWTNNALSDLGVQSGVTAPLFNGGLITGGILFCIFALGLYRFAGTDTLGKVSSALFFIACISIILIGIFNEDFRPTHYIVSVMLFVFLPISMLSFVAAFWKQNKRNLSLFTLAIALIAASVWVLQFTVHYVPNVAIPETISAAAGCIWVWVQSYRMLKNKA
ncbi:MAG: DUF998 domain-containing protein [Candidatus Bathyarchaeota archaeon]|nr:DUF998 domain-containing protein [Candidatus Bathyarchaeota archaeon]